MMRQLSLQERLLQYVETKKPGRRSPYILHQRPDEAIAHLPADWDESNKGRGDIRSCNGIERKSPSTTNNTNKQPHALENVINSGEYALYSDCENLFKPGGDESSEMIFAIQNIGGVDTDFGMPMTFYMGSRASYGSCWNICNGSY